MQRASQTSRLSTIFTKYQYNQLSTLPLRKLHFSLQSRCPNKTLKTHVLEERDNAGEGEMGWSAVLARWLEVEDERAQRLDAAYIALVAHHYHVA